MSAEQAPDIDDAQSLSTAVASVNDCDTAQNGSALHSPSEQHLETPNEEQALESHEVIELQTFSERKAWIEEKIQFLEKMPPIEVFVGLDALRSSAENVPGLPTRDELQRWVNEHDMIEKETEIFDTGELTKLRQLTKAATQRNLSPEDTDVIELTLTTIYALDKLLHLLRDRSENLELLGIRLTWEESRSTAWIDRQKILDDLKAFLDTRARWKSSMYEVGRIEDKEVRRRGSIASMASAASDTSLYSPAFSRSARFKLAELLSRDGAQFGARVTSLRHGKIAAAGKALDKLIDHSRKPVPEELLDEQDRLEDKGINEMENLGKFVMNLVMQWRKADEIYVETMKDQISAQNLLEEIETAKMHHPTPRQSSSFISRADTLLKRFHLRGNPISNTSTFPFPEHPLIGDQQACNNSLAELLSSEITAGADMARKVDAAAKEYRSNYEAVKRVESLLDTSSEISHKLTSIIKQLDMGVPDGADGDGTPPNLTTPSCLEPTRHSVFLALFPSIAEEISRICNNTDEVLRDAKLALIGLDLPGIDPMFKTKAVSDFQGLAAIQAKTKAMRDDVSGRASRLRESRRLVSSMDAIVSQLEETSVQILGVMERKRWRQETGGIITPLTPESPISSPLPEPFDFTHQELDDRLEYFKDKLLQDVDIPLASFSQTLESPVREWLVHSSDDIKTSWNALKQLASLLVAVQNQASVMASVRDQFNCLQVRMEDMRIRLTSDINDILQDTPLNQNPVLIDSDIQSDFKAIQRDVARFSNELASRVPFITRQPTHFAKITVVKRRFSSGNLSLGTLQEPSGLPFDPVSLDAAVRADSNSYIMKLGGQLQALEHSIVCLECARVAKELDSRLSPLDDEVRQITQQLSTMRHAYESIITEGSLETLKIMFNDVETFTLSCRTRISRSFFQLRDSLRHLDTSSHVLDLSTRDRVYSARSRTVSGAELRFKAWVDGITALHEDLGRAMEMESQRLDKIRSAEEEFKLKEAARLAAEEVERHRLEQERLKQEEIERLEEQHLKNVQLQEAEWQRIQLEEAERARLKRERADEEEKQREEERVKAQAVLRQTEMERIIAEEAERARLQRENEEMQEKLRAAEEQLLKERQLQAEKEQLATVKANQERISAKETEKRVTENISIKSPPTSKKSRVRHLVSNASNNKQHPYSGVDSRVMEDDVFGLQLASLENGTSRSKEMLDLQTKILALRKRLRSISISEALRPTKAGHQLPNEGQLMQMTHSLSVVASEAKDLPLSVEDTSVNAELRSLQTEIRMSGELLKDIQKLVAVSIAVQHCDAALSDLLEHIDSYPALPSSVMTSMHVSKTNGSPEEQLSARLAFTRSSIIHLNSKFSAVDKDSRAIAERGRILQTWSELEEMGNDRLGGKRSRPGSVTSTKNSSGRNSSASAVNPRIAKKGNKAGSYSNLSVSLASSRGGLLAPPRTASRRVVSGSDEPLSRSMSRLSSISSNRSVSGPLNTSLYGSTFASRQRTSSLSSNASTPVRETPTISLHSHARLRASQTGRSGSPAISEASSYSRSSMLPTRSSTTSTSTWARAPRNSLSSIIGRVTTPQKKVPAPATRKKYIADPKSKLDVAVGDVVNQLPVGINVEGLSETWQDQSGKYWIGNQDPKLCFCRILRSQTVMVRVGGGWTELSKFIKDHFADSFRLLSESPRPRAQEEKWISSAILLDVNGREASPPAPPRTPEPTFPFLPSFALSTPSGQSPHSMNSSPSAKGSPLTPLQFMRRADIDPSLLRPSTPSKVPLRNKNSTMLVRNSIWRP